MIGDTVQTIGVLIAGIIIMVNPEYKIADPICTFLFSIIVLFTTITIIRDALHVLMEGSLTLPTHPFAQNIEKRKIT